MSTNQHPTFDNTAASSPASPTSNDLNAAISYTSSKLSASWPQVLEIKDSISNGGSIPTISEAEQVTSIINDQTPAGALKTAQSQAQTIVTEWSQAAAAGTIGFGDLSAQVSRLFSGSATDSKASQQASGEGLAGLLGSLGSLTSSLGAGYATALVLAVGEAHAPAGAWAEATGEQHSTQHSTQNSDQNSPGTDAGTGAGSGAGDTSAA